MQVHEGYPYVLYEKIHTLFPQDEDNNIIYEVGQSVWVLRSNGRRLELFESAIILQLFATKALVEYTQKSTYRVPLEHLIPVVKQPCIIVCCETNLYRRACVVHATDSNFCEIGCAFGDTCQRVYRYHQSKVLGIDKSVESIEIAKSRHRGIDFRLSDVLKDGLPEKVARPLVVAVDINGNREIGAVQDCLTVVLESIQPEVVVVKSRAMYNQLTGQPELPRNVKQTEKIRD